MPTPQVRGVSAYYNGLSAEDIVRKLFDSLGFEILAQRLRTPYGELDLVVADAEWCLAVEVKRRRSLSDGAASLTPRQSQRLLAAFEYCLATKPEWHRPNTRFDVVVVDQQGQARRIMDALRQF